MKKSKKKIIKIIILILLLIFIIPGLYAGLTVRSYTITDDRFTDGIRIALVTDLHSCRYGKDESKLINAVDEQAPDIVLLGGDIFDDVLSDDNSEAFLSYVCDKYPCYYVSGNHECWSEPEKHKHEMSIIDSLGIIRLRGDADILTVRGQQIRICGIDDPDIYIVRSLYGEDYIPYNDQLSALEGIADDDIFTILLAHRPERFYEYKKFGFDLILAGHAHGGQWRIPGLINGLFAPDQGLFPKYAGGYYNEDGNTMIVSRGLGRESTLLPRFYDPPELVIIDIVNN